MEKVKLFSYSVTDIYYACKIAEVDSATIMRIVDNLIPGKILATEINTKGRNNICVHHFNCDSRPYNRGCTSKRKCYQSFITKYANNKVIQNIEPFNN